MGRATGATAQMLLKEETEYGTAPSGNYNAMRFLTSDLGAQQNLIADEVLGTFRQPSDPARDVIETSGTIAVPIDLRLIGWWLKGLLGAPVTTNPSDYLHTFVGAANTLPSLAIEIGHTLVPKYFMNVGCVVSQMQLQWQASGQAQATVTVTAQNETAADTSAGGTPVDMGYQRFHQFQGKIDRGGAPLGNIVSVDMTINNNVDPARVIRADGLIDGVDLGNLTATGSLTARFADTVLHDLAVADTPVSLALGWVIDADKQLLITIPEVHLGRGRRNIQGPAGVQVTHDFQIAKPDAGEALTVALYNDVAAYA